VLHPLDDIQGRKTDTDEDRAARRLDDETNSDFSSRKIKMGRRQNNTVKTS
jgi:hypothetical protein